MSKRIDELIANQLLFDSAWEVTQFYRGELFTFVDCLLVEKIPDVESEAIVLQFFVKTLELIVAWLKAFPGLLESFEAGVENYEKYLTDPKVALAYCQAELIFTLKRLFGDDQRTAVFFANNFDRDTEALANATYAMESEYSEYGVVYLIEQFGQLGGFEALLSLAQMGPDKRCPLEILSDIPFSSIASHLSDGFSAQYIPQYREAILERVTNVSNKEIKEINKQYFSQILENLAILMGRLSSSEENYELVETMELDLMMKFIKCGLLEKRLRGINEIREFIERVEYVEPAVVVQANPIRPTKWLNDERLTNWMTQNNLVTLLLGEYNHVEVIKRCPDIVKFLAKNNALTAQHIDLILESSVGKHDSIIRGIYKLIVDMAASL
jgi:hypothetical protein